VWPEHVEGLGHPKPQTLVLSAIQDDGYLKQETRPGLEILQMRLLQSLRTIAFPRGEVRYGCPGLINDFSRRCPKET
jgi:hypothetical protein